MDLQQIPRHLLVHGRCRSGRDREKNFVVITGLKEFGDANEMHSDNAHPNPKGQRLSDQSAAQPSNPPRPSYSMTVKLLYGRYWVEYTCTYSPSTTTFINQQPIEISAASAASLEAQKKTNKDMYEQLVVRETFMMYVDTRDDEGERILSAELRVLVALSRRNITSFVRCGWYRRIFWRGRSVC